MIRIADKIDMVPDLFNLSPRFERCVDNADVEIWPAALSDEITDTSNVFTIFINRECDSHNADILYQNHHRLRPNNIFAVTGYHPQVPWPFPVVYFWSNVYFTLRSNSVRQSLEVKPKSHDGCALFGGWDTGRQQLALLMKDYDLINKCFLSLHRRYFDHTRFTPDEIKKHFYYQSPDIRNLDRPEFNKLAYTISGLDTMPMYSDSRHFWISMLIPYELYNRSYFSIVAETESFPLIDTVFLSEKIAKPLIAGHPFFVYGATNYLKYLQNHGFQTFSSWVDERYDTVQPPARAKALIKSFAKFANQSDSAKFHMFAEMQEVCKHNQRLATDPAFLLKPLVDTILQKFPE